MRHSRKTLLDSSCLRQTSALLLRLVMAAFLVLLCSTGLTVLSTSFHVAWAQDSGGDSGGSDGSGSDSGTSEGESTDPSTCELCGGGGSDQNGGGADSSETGQTEQGYGSAFGREDGYGYAYDGAGYSFGANYGFGDMSQTGLSLGQNDFGGLFAGTTEMASEPSFNSSMAGLPGAPGNEMLGASLGVEQMLSDAPRPQDSMSVEVALGPVQSRDELVGGMLLGAGAGAAVVGSSAVQSGSSPSLTEQAQGAWNSVVDAVQGFFGGMFSEEADIENRFPDRSLPRDKHGNPTPEPEAEGPHTQLGQKDGRNGRYDQAREFDANGNPIRDIDFTDHGRPDSHPNPHQHDYLPNPTGGTPQRGPTKPLSDG